MISQSTETPQGTQAAFPAGQVLVCTQCGASIEILKPCGCSPPDQVLRCCDRDMVPKSS